MGAKQESVCKLLNTLEEKVFNKEDVTNFKSVCQKAIETTENRFHKERFAQLELIIEFMNLPKSYQYKAAVINYQGLMANHSYAREKDCECPLIKQKQESKHNTHDALLYSAGEVY